mmetsp:Transcript_12883/g.34711  ORF Transcript_12883/g.34711 Transcript_12883/m.34711 type:complete len:125 (-) Transcript_12883:543-917(-)
MGSADVEERALDSAPKPAGLAAHGRGGGGGERIVFVRNLPYKMSAEELYDLFGKYGSVRQIRQGTAPTTRGTAYVVYDFEGDAKRAVDKLSGFNVGGRYIVLQFHQQAKLDRKALADRKRKAER